MESLLKQFSENGAVLYDQYFGHGNIASFKIRLNDPGQSFDLVERNLSSSERNPSRGNDLPCTGMQPHGIPANHNW